MNVLNILSLHKLSESDEEFGQHCDVCLVVDIDELLQIEPGHLAGEWVSALEVVDNF